MTLQDFVLEIKCDVPMSADLKIIGGTSDTAKGAVETLWGNIEFSFLQGDMSSVRPPHGDGKKRLAFDGLNTIMLREGIAGKRKVEIGQYVQPRVAILHPQTTDELEWSHFRTTHPDLLIETQFIRQGAVIVGYPVTQGYTIEFQMTPVETVKENGQWHSRCGTMLRVLDIAAWSMFSIEGRFIKPFEMRDDD